jgi:hypothetical protein
MTVCAAAICAQRRAIVLVSDQMVSYGDVVGDRIMSKNMEAHPSWIAMVAASDVTHITPIMEAVVERIYPSAHNWQEQSLSSVQAAFVSAIEREVERPKQAVIRAHHFRDYAHLTSHGPAYFGSRWPRIESKLLWEMDLLVGGFDARHRPHLFTIDQATVIETHDRPPFAAIGSGEHLAMKSMDRQRLSAATTLADAVHGVLKAKQAAESANGVGRATFIVTLHVDHKRCSLTDGEVRRLRRMKKREAVRFLEKDVFSRLELKDIVYR